MTINQYEVTIQGILFSKKLLINSTSEESAKLSAMSLEEFAPERCFSVKFIKCIYSSKGV
jgi:hypothetical protein